MASSINVIKLTKLENVCRTCLSKELVPQSIFDVYSGSITFDYVINAVTGLKIEQGDGFPSNICQGCKDKAISAFDFRKKSQETHDALQTLIKKAINTTPHDVKEEQPADDADDGLDIDFSLPVTPENCSELASIKNENEGDIGHQCNQQCKTCPDVFDTSRLRLREHVDKKCVKVEYEDEQSTYCPLCGACFDNSDSLTKHMWTSHADLMGPKKRGRPKKLLTSTILSKLSENGCHTKTGPMKKTKSCIFCKDEFKTRLELSGHMMEHKGTKIQCCILCKKMYLNILNFEQHACFDDRNNSIKMLNEHETLSIPSDNAKVLNYLTEVLLQDLLDPNGDMENMNVLEVCSICREVFLSESHLASHNDAEHPELSQRCNLCSKVFASVKSAARHRNICKQIERKYICSTCGLKFAYEISLNKHILRYHEGQSVSVKFMDPKTKSDERQFQCDTCKRSFYRKDLLARHTKQHMPSEKLFECDVCKKKFHRRDNLRSHKRVHEVHRDKSASNNCLCLYCGRSFSNSSNLIVHMRRHTGEKPYKCDFCGKGFPRSSDLQCHRRSHTGEKPCICVVCGKGFSRSNKLSRHMRVHTGHKPYKCTYCDKAFSQSNDLTLHVRRHTGDKPYICEVCGDRFIQGTSLHNHRRAHGHFPASSSGPHSNVQGLTYTSVTPHG
ncbi:zinc finger protein 28-like isoform X1 [Cydia splendana]|uniref:zinc finger protein 28-like isoform X1 n=1 Tax=Cydia splendana TaxID=1100963 RepID=UPI002140AAA9